LSNDSKKATTRGDPLSRAHTTIRYIPHTEHDLAEMLTALGVRTLDETRAARRPLWRWKSVEEKYAGVP
jgi:glutamate synthase domain-containing protein 2